VDRTLLSARYATGRAIRFKQVCLKMHSEAREVYACCCSTLACTDPSDPANSSVCSDVPTVGDVVGSVGLFGTELCKIERQYVGVLISKAVGKRLVTV
jgi:hypothetical protein